MFSIIETITLSRRLHDRICWAVDDESMGEDASGHWIEAREIFKNLATAMNVLVEPSLREIADAEDVAGKLYRAALTLRSRTAGSFHSAGAIAALHLRFGHMARVLGFRMLTSIDDDAARGESEAEVAAQ